MKVVFRTIPVLLSLVLLSTLLPNASTKALEFWATSASTSSDFVYNINTDSSAIRPYRLRDFSQYTQHYVNIRHPLIIGTSVYALAEQNFQDTTERWDLVRLSPTTDLMPHLYWILGIPTYNMDLSYIAESASDTLHTDGNAALGFKRSGNRLFGNYKQVMIRYDVSKGNSTIVGVLPNNLIIGPSSRSVDWHDVASLSSGSAYALGFVSGSVDIRLFKLDGLNATYISDCTNGLYSLTSDGVNLYSYFYDSFNPLRHRIVKIDPNNCGMTSVLDLNSLNIPNILSIDIVASKQIGKTWHNWETFPGSLLSSPECQSMAAAQADCWARLASGGLGWWRYDGSSATNIVDLGGPVLSVPSCLDAGGKQQCFVQLASNQLGQITRSGTKWSAWISLGNNIRRRPSCLSVDQTKITCVVLNAKNKLQSRSWSGKSWGTWSSLATSLTFAEAPTCYTRAGGIDCVAADTKGRLQFLRRGSSEKWEAAKNLGGTVAGIASCVAPSTTTRACFIQGSDHTLRRIYFNGSAWSAWENLGGTLASAPSCTQLNGTEANCFAVAANGELQQKAKIAAVWQPWTSLSGSLAVVRPSCVSLSTARMDCFARSASNAIAHRAYY